MKMEKGRKSMHFIRNVRNHFLYLTRDGEFTENRT
jgi:hypothetical protein